MQVLQLYFYDERGIEKFQPSERHDGMAPKGKIGVPHARPDPVYCFLFTQHPRQVYENI